MKLNTLRFGEIEISKDKIIHFESGIPPFESKNYTLINSEDTYPFLWLQSLDEPELALSVIEPGKLFPKYSPTVSNDILELIGDPAEEDIVLLTVCVITRDYDKMFTNLVSPILINSRNNEARQIIMENTHYLTKQNIYNEVRALVIGGDDDVSSNS